MAKKKVNPNFKLCGTKPSIAGYYAALMFYARRNNVSKNLMDDIEETISGLAFGRQEIEKYIDLGKQINYPRIPDYEWFTNLDEYVEQI